MTAHPCIRINRVVIACTGEFKGNARRDFSEQESRKNRLIDVWEIEKLTEHVTNFYPEFFFDLDRDAQQYLDGLEGELCSIEHEVRRYGQRLGLSWEDVFVEPKVAVLESVRRVGGQRVRTTRSGLVRDPKTELDVGGLSRLTERDEHMILLGPPGIGKSTLMRKAALDMLRAHGTPGGTGVKLPLWVDARKLAEVAADADLVALLQATSACDAPPVQLISEALKGPGIVIFIDDFDAVIDKEKRAILMGWLERLSQVDPKVRVITGARLSLFERTELVAKYTPTIIFPFALGSIRRLLEKFLGGTKAIGVLKAFVEKGSGSSLPRTPLVITMLALLHRQEEFGEIPANIAELYGMVTEVYLGRWKAEVGGQEAYRLRKSITGLLAYELHCRRKWSVAVSDAQSVISSYLKARDRDEDSVAILDDLRECGLLRLVDENAQIGFSDKSFQEYFAALHAYGDSDIGHRLAEKFDDPWWMDCITFLAGLSENAPKVVATAIRATRNTESPELAFLMALQFGQLVQAASMTETRVKRQGVEHASDLIQFFYSFYAERLNDAKVSVKFSRTALLLSTALFFAESFNSRHLVTATDGAAGRLLKDFEASTGDARMRTGIRALCVCSGAALQRDYAPLQKFIGMTTSEDAALFHAIGWVVEFTAPAEIEGRTAEQRWKELVRTAQKMTSKAGVTNLYELKDDVKRMDGGVRLVDGNGQPSLFRDDEGKASR